MTAADEAEHPCLFRADLSETDLVTHSEDMCDAQLRLPNGVTDDCTREAGHAEEHYSFSGDPRYEIVWPRS